MNDFKNQIKACEKCKNRVRHKPHYVDMHGNTIIENICLLRQTLVPGEHIPQTNICIFLHLKEYHTDEQ